MWSLFAVLLCSATAFARIGETGAQIEKRYGQPTSSRDSIKTYSYKNFFVIVRFDRGISAIETFQRSNNGAMSAEDIAGLLNANGGGEKWSRPMGNGFEVSYRTKTRVAEYNEIANTLTIADSRALNRVNTRDQSGDAQK